MEEKNEAKVVELKNNSQENKPKKLSYEELENIAHQLSEQSRQLYTQLQQADKTNLFTRLEYLFKVVENAPSFPEEFSRACVDEIQDLMTIPRDEVEGESDETKE